LRASSWTNFQEQIVDIKRFIVLAAAAAGFLAGCSAEQPDDGHAHEEPTTAVTHYTADTELFVEFPALVRDKDAEFLAHLTRLADFKAVSEGTLVVTLSGGGEPEESGEAGVSQTPGIFKPLLAPRHAGKRRLRFTLTAPGLNVTHDVGEVEVFAAPPAAPASAGEVPDAGIRYTKEQQWRVDFAVEQATRRAVRESIPVTALIRPRAAGEARIAAPAAGLLRAPSPGLPQIGSRVAAGQVLGYLLPKLGAQSDMATLELAVSKAKLEADLAAGELVRLEGLLRAEAVAEKRVLEARYRERTAQAELSAAQRRVAAYQGGTGGIALKSPISGTVVALAGQAGASLEQGATIFHVADLGRLWLEAKVPESDLGRVGTPAGAFFKLDGEEKAVVLEVGKNARLVAFGGLVDPETRTVPAILEFENPGDRLKAGMQLRAGLYTGRVSQGVAVPTSAIVDDSGQPVVFVQKGGESFERRLVTPGARDGDRVAVPSGVSPGERIVTRGAWQVRLAASAPAQAGHGHAH
jgi:RND family efflux transporter MFP subunit